MNRLVILLFALFGMHTAFAQPGLGDPGKMPGSVTGKIVDAAGKPVEFANVIVFRNYQDATGKPKRLFQSGTPDQADGSFTIENLPPDTSLTISISAVGYTVFNQNFRLSAPQLKINLGELKLTGGKKELAGVTVTAAKPYMSVDMDKKVFNVTKDIVSNGGTGLDVIKNVPSVNVDIDGNVSMRGAAPQVFVDGKPTMLTLDEIPSDAIESVEVISNPSAKYDASGGGAGILNIVLKKNRKSGYNGSLRAGVDSHGGINAGGGINVRTKKFNVSLDVNTKTMRDYIAGTVNRNDFSATPSYTLAQQQADTSRGWMMFSKASLDYYVTDKTTLSLSMFMVHHQSKTSSNSAIAADTSAASGLASGYSHQGITNDHSFNGRGATLGMKHLFKKEKEVWTVDGNLFSGNSTSNSSYATSYFTDAGNTSMTSSQLQKIHGSGSDYNIILQSDYVNPLSSKMTLETGVRAAFQHRKNLNDNYTYDDASAAYLLVPAAASNYTSESNVYAAYATLSGNIGNLTYKGGLRAESSSYNGTLLGSGQTFSNSYPLSLFPSLFIGEKLGNDQELQLTYTRRVNRPNFFQLIPYTDSSNKLNITKGNPDLVPEFTQSLEFSYLKNFRGLGTFMGSLYYKHTDHLITGYVAADANAAGDVTYINTYINAASSYAYGSELTGQFGLTKWWDLTANVNIYRSQIDLGTGSSASQQAPMWSWFGKLNTTFKLPAGFALQLTGTYQSKTNLPVSTGNNQPGPPDILSQSASQGYIKPYYVMDAALKKNFMAGKLVASLGVSDIFASRKQDQYTYSDYFTQEYTRLRNPQMLRLNLAYNFGKLEMNHPQERKNNDAQTEE